MDDNEKRPVNDVSKDEEAITKNTEKIETEPDPAGLDPTRFGDWEKNGRCIDF